MDILTQHTLILPNELDENYACGWKWKNCKKSSNGSKAHGLRGR